MKAYGYPQNNKKNLLELSECTLECTLDEIEKICDFLKKYKEDVEKGIQNGLWTKGEENIVHRHYGNMSMHESVDFIISTRIKKEGTRKKTGDGLREP